MTPERPDLMTVKEAAEWLGLSAEHLRRLARQGKVPAVKAGSRPWRFYLTDLQTWLAEGRPVAGQQPSLFPTPKE